MVADRHPVGVPGQVLQHLLRARRRAAWRTRPTRSGRWRRAGVGTRRRPPARRASRGRRACPGRRRRGARRGTCPGRPRLSTRTGRKKPRPAGDPARAVGREPAAGHDAVDVGVVLQGLPPGVQDGQEADLGPEVLGVGGDLLQGLRGGPEQQVVDDPRVLQGDRPERRREGEDDMEVLDREQLGRPRLDPPRRLGGLALGAVAVAARVVGDLPVAAPVAGLDVPAQGRRAAAGQVASGRGAAPARACRRTRRGRRRRGPG